MKYKLSQLFNIIGGGTPKTSIKEYWGGNIPWLSVKDFNNDSRYVYSAEKTITEAGLANSSTTLLQKDDIIISARGTVGEIASIPFPMAFNQSCYGLRARKEICDTDYLYYLLKLKVVELKHNSHGSVFDTITRDTFDGIEGEIPEIDIQRKIGEILSQIDQKIELNNTINNNLQQQADTLFKVWFIDNPDSLSWQEGVFADLIDAVHSGDWGKETQIGTYTQQVYCIRGADIPSIKCGDRGKMPTRFIQAKNLVEKKLCNGDIVVEISGGSPTQSTGRAAPIVQSLIDRYDGDMVCTNFCKALTPKQHSSLFVYYYWQYLYDKGVFFTYENGTTGIKNLNIAGILENERIHIPPTHMIEQFDSLCGKYWDKIASNGLESERLAALRDSLLPKLMSGEIDVSDVEI